ncbi:hypothetical protein ABPG74_006768 [Tetrahymena malaccensis]
MIQKKQYFKDLKNLLISDLSSYTDLHIELWDKKVNDQIVSELRSKIAKCFNLKSLNLDLRYNDIEDQGVSDLASGLEECSNLESLALDLRHSFVKDQGLLELVNKLGKLNQLQELNLNLRYTSFTSQGLSDLGQGLSKCMKIQTLELILESYSQISDVGASNLCSGIINCSNIGLSLSLMINDSCEKNGLQLCTQLAKLTNIETLQLDLDLDSNNNNISDAGIPHLTSVLAECKQISVFTIQLEGNFILDYGVSHLLSGLKKCAKISSLGLNLQGPPRTKQLINNIQNKINKMPRLVQYQLEIDECDPDYQFNLDYPEDQISEEGNDSYQDSDQFDDI